MKRDIFSSTVREDAARQDAGGAAVRATRVQRHFSPDPGARRPDAGLIEQSH